MRFSLPVSFALHGGLLAFAMISFAETKPFKPPEPEPVEVAIITEDGLTRLKEGSRESKLLEAAAAKAAPDSKAVKEPPPKAKPPEAAAPPPPPPEPVKVEPPPPPPEPVKVEPPPPPKRDEIAMLAEKAEQQAKEDELALLEAQKKAAEEKQRQEQAKKLAEDQKRLADDQKRKEDLKKKQDEAKRLADLKKKQDELKKKQDDAKKLADAKKKQNDELAELEKALKDNDPSKRAPPPPGGTPSAVSGPKGPAAGAPEGKDTVLTASQGALLGKLIKDAVSKCWKIQTGAEGIEKIVVKLEVQLRPDGRLAQPPKILNTMPGTLFADTATSAVRAVMQCEADGYRFPPELYKGGWENLIWTFDPRKMF